MCCGCCGDEVEDVIKCQLCVIHGCSSDGNARARVGREEYMGLWCWILELCWGGRCSGRNWDGGEEMMMRRRVVMSKEVEGKRKLLMIFMGMKKVSCICDKAISMGVDYQAIYDEKVKTPDRADLLGQTLWLYI